MEVEINVLLQSDIEVEDTSNPYGYRIISVKHLVFMSLSVLNTTLVVQPTSPSYIIATHIIATEGLRAGDQVQSFIPGFDSALAGNSTVTDDKSKGGGCGCGRFSIQSLAVGLLRSLTLIPGNVLPL
jgi:hypothetical protein